MSDTQTNLIDRESAGASLIQRLGKDYGLDLAREAEALDTATASERVDWAVKHFGDRVVMSSSFGAQAAVTLHLVTQRKPDMPVILVDTGYLFPETYRFIDDLTARLKLNLQIYRPEMSGPWQEARYGKLWEKGLTGIERYNLENKVKPMGRALDELGADLWIAGLRRQQSSTRKQLRALAVSGDRLKLHPILEWTDKDIFDYLIKYDLPYHPLWEEGYISIGDWHTSHKLTDGMSEEETRFFGLKRECGLHEGTDYVI